MILDLAADAYLCRPGAACGARPDLDDAGRAPPAGLPAKGWRPLPPGPDRLRAGERLALLFSLLDLVRLYPGRSLVGVLDAVSARRRGTAPAQAEALRIARAFQRVAIWLPISAKCLVRSFLLARLLQRCGQGGAWLVGVRTWPFGAHCWLQHGDVVLDEHPERLAPFAVIHGVEV